MDETPRFPLLRIMLGNALLLSGIYLALGLVVEGLRRWVPSEGVDRLSLVLDSLAGRVLVETGAMSKLRELYLYNHLSNSSLRLIFELTTVLVIFALALVVGFGMYLVHWWVERLERRRSAPRA